jgi:hypothetical protein
MEISLMSQARYIAAIGGTDDAEVAAGADGTVVAIIKGILSVIGDTLKDNLVDAIKVIRSPHHEVHEGDAYETSYKSPDPSPIADNALFDLLIQVGPKPLHFTFDALAGGDAEILLYEGATVSATGTELNIFNLNRLQPDASSVIFAAHTPTLTATGTTLLNEFLPGGTGGQTAGGQSRDAFERIFRTGTAYMLRQVNRAGTAQPMSNHVQWYEEEL